VTFTRERRYDSRPVFDARLSVPAGWSSMNIKNGMSDVQQGVMASSPDKSAVVIVVDHASTDEYLVDYGALSWLALSGGGVVDEWGDIEPASLRNQDGVFTTRRGRGRLGRNAADLLMLRRAIGKSTTLIVISAIRKDATDRTRLEYLACLASFRDATLGTDPPIH
jgi:hypothetical protein